MPEIRAAVPMEIHRKLKSEAVRDGKHLKDLVAEILAAHTRNTDGDKQSKPRRKRV